MQDFNLKDVVNLAFKIDKSQNFNMLTGSFKGRTVKFFPPGQISPKQKLDQDFLAAKFQTILKQIVFNAKQERKLDISLYTHANVSISKGGDVTLKMKNDKGEEVTLKDTSGQFAELIGELLSLAKNNFPPTADYVESRESEDKVEDRGERRAGLTAETAAFTPTSVKTAAETRASKRKGQTAALDAISIAKSQQKDVKREQAKKREQKEASLHEDIIRDDVKKKRLKSDFGKKP